jgi:chromosome condensin MukBEF MukE localization factor
MKSNNRADDNRLARIVLGRARRMELENQSVKCPDTNDAITRLRRLGLMWSKQDGQS